MLLNLIIFLVWKCHFLQFPEIIFIRSITNEENNNQYYMLNFWEGLRVSSQNSDNQKYKEYNILPNLIRYLSIFFQFP